MEQFEPNWDTEWGGISIAFVMLFFGNTSWGGPFFIDGAGADGDFQNARTLFRPFLRYYFPINDDQAIYSGMVTGFVGSTSDVTNKGINQSVDNSITALGFGPRYSIIAGDNIALET